MPLEMNFRHPAELAQHTSKGGFQLFMSLSTAYQALANIEHADIDTARWLFKSAHEQFKLSRDEYEIGIQFVPDFLIDRRCYGLLRAEFSQIDSREEYMIPTHFAMEKDIYIYFLGALDQLGSLLRSIVDSIVESNGLSVALHFMRGASLVQSLGLQATRLIEISRELQGLNDEYLKGRATAVAAGDIKLEVPPDFLRY